MTTGIQTNNDGSTSFQINGSNVMVVDTLLDTTFTGAIILPIGNTINQPLLFRSGTNLATANAGSMEYDGKVLYATPQGTQRGVIPSSQFFRLNADYVGANTTAAQSVFGVGVTLSSSTVYTFEGMYLLGKTVGTTTHTVSYSFGGTATINNIGGFVDAQFATTNFSTPLLTAGNEARAGFINTTAVSIYATSASATQYHTVFVKGTVSINVGGTFIPQYTTSAAPAGSYSTTTGSYFHIYPISTSGANTNVGTWA